MDNAAVLILSFSARSVGSRQLNSSEPKSPAHKFLLQINPLGPPMRIQRSAADGVGKVLRTFRTYCATQFGLMTREGCVGPWADPTAQPLCLG